MTTTRTRPLTAVPGASVSDDRIHWPSGLVTWMHCWALTSEEHAQLYRRQPIHFNTEQVRAMRRES